MGQGGLSTWAGTEKSEDTFSSVPIAGQSLSSRPVALVVLPVSLSRSC